MTIAEARGQLIKLSHIMNNQMIPTKEFNDCTNVKAILRHKRVHSILLPKREYKERRWKFQTADG